MFYDPFLETQMRNTRLDLIEEDTAIHEGRHEAARTMDQRSDATVFNVQDRLGGLHDVVEDATTAFNQSAAEQRKRALKEKMRLAALRPTKHSVGNDNSNFAIWALVIALIIYTRL